MTFRWGLTEDEDERTRRLHAAIRLSMCDYCQASAFDPCVSFRGKETSWHIRRVGRAHQLLIDFGFPGRASHLIVRRRQEKGHTRKHWHRRLREEGARQ